ncbi:MAG: molybdopterin-dependent oxidoreductase, partial [Actinomycetaceae bacterium]|nr:molybdopterin-dependent oxidoreductase [Actinomycetaceae bacterium]
MSAEKSEQTEEPRGISRRHFVGGSAAVVGALALGSTFINGQSRHGLGETHGTGEETDAYTAQDVIYSMCMQCNAYCTIKVRLTEPGNTEATALVRKIAGNPYSPLNTQPQGPIPYDTNPEEAVFGLGDMARDAKSRSGGIACLKGQSGIQIVHDNFRVTQPLKRVGGRGSDEWQTISWDQAIKEILEGAEDIGTEGLKNWYAFAPEEPVMADFEKVKAGELSQEEFEATWGDKLLDPKKPMMGPKSNQLAVLCGERQPLIGQRLANNTFGTINQFNHGGTCGMSGVQGNVHTHPTTKFKRMYMDIDYCEYMIVWGTEPTTAQKGPTWMAPRIGAARERGMKLVVIDPRMSKTAEKADVWMPVKPGKDIELAFALGRWIVDHKRYDEQYLRAPSKAAAEAIGEPTWSDATHLVWVDDKDNKRPKINAWAMGQAEAPEDPATADPMPMCMVNGEPRIADETSELADLEFDGVVDGKHLKTVFTLYRERLEEKTWQEWAEESGLEADQVAQVAEGLTSHGKRAGIMSYRGPAMHYNGYDTIRAINYLNFLIGNHDWKGGHITKQKNFPTTTGKWELVKVPGGNKGWGYPISREKVTYEKTPFFKEDGYPAKRRWSMFTGNACHEVIPSAYVGYPYFLKALFINRHTPLNSSPGAGKLADMLKDQEKLPLVVVFDIEISDTGRFADYILPDLTYLEKFCQESVYPSQQYACTQFGQPTTRAFEGPRTVEDVYVDIAKGLGLKGVGKDAFGPGFDFNESSDYWIKMACNIAYGDLQKDKPVPDASAEEIALFEATRKKYLGDTFDLEKWKSAVRPEEWPKVVTILNRGGRFSGSAPDRADGYSPDGKWLKYRYEGMCQFYDPKTAAQKDCMDNGKPFEGIAVAREPRFSDGTVIAASDEFPLQMVNWKARTQGTYRTLNSAWLRELGSENFVWISASDAAARGIENGDRIRIKSSTHEEEGRAYVLQGIRPGVIGAASAFGQKGYAAGEVVIDGKVRKPAPEYGNGKTKSQDLPGSQESGFAQDRSLGIQVNAFLPEDTGQLGGYGFNDPIGG